MTTEPQDPTPTETSTTEELMHADMREVEEQPGATGDAPAKLAEAKAAEAASDRPADPDGPDDRAV